MILKFFVFGTFLWIGYIAKTSLAHFSWPQGRIPYLDDLALTADPDQAVALNNARMDLQVRSCIRFVPRRYEKDFVFFTDLGPQIECWNMFDYTKGRVEVNAGPSCLEPMRRPHRPKRIFSDCDLEYVNHLYNCPRRRQHVSPICPMGHQIMAIPLATFTTTTITETTPTSAATTLATTTSTETTMASAEMSTIITTMSTTTDEFLTEDPIFTHSFTDESTANTDYEMELTEDKDTTIDNRISHEVDESTVRPDSTEKKKVDHEGSNKANEFRHSVPHNNELVSETVEVDNCPGEMSHEHEEMITQTIDESAVTEKPSTLSASIDHIHSIAEIEGNNSTLSPSTLLMMTLITSSMTTTTMSPPEWVKSIEESFKHRENSEIDSTNHYVNKYGGKGHEIGQGIAIEIVGDSGPGIDARGIESNYIDSMRKGFENNRNGNELVIEGGENLKGRPEKGAYSISQTKVITTIEKSNYVGSCGSACSYSGDLVKLYRSYNDKMDVTNHFYTTDRLEHHLMASQGYMMQPHMGYLGRNHVDPLCSCLKPLYRLYNEFMKDHLLTSTEQEKDMAERILGYKFERVLGFCTKEPGCGAYVPLYRFYNAIAKDHLYTIDQQEMHYYRTHPEHAYGFEYIECYVWQHNSSSKGCPTLMLDDFARL